MRNPSPRGKIVPLSGMVRSPVQRKMNKNRKKEKLAPLMSLWVDEAEEASAGDVPLGKTHVRAVLSKEQAHLMRASENPIEFDESNQMVETPKEKRVTDLRKNLPRKTKSRSRTASAAQEILQKIAEEASAPKTLTQKISRTMTRRKESNTELLALSMKAQQRTQLPEDFSYDLSLYNSPESRGMKTRSGKIRMVPHPCAGSNEKRWELYKVGAFVSAEVPSEARQDFSERPPVPPRQVAKIRRERPPTPPRLERKKKVEVSDREISMILKRSDEEESRLDV